MSSRISTVLLVVVACGLASFNSALAGWLPPEGTQVVVISAESSQGSSSKGWMFPPGEIDGRYVWDLPGSYELTGDGGLVGTIGDLGVGVEVDPALSLNFTVTAGAVPTTFTITTAVLGFAPINNPLAFATAAITVTDNDHDGAMTTGLQPGGKAYQARINAGVPWANLVDMVMSLPDDSATGSERRPTPSGREMIAGLVSSIQTEFKFTLTANDSASGTSRFDIIPEPATLGLLVAGGLALLRRRSR